ISRATSGKFMATPSGVFELRYFFATPLAASRGGEEHSAEAVRSLLRSLIEKEGSGGVLSDEKLVEMLRGSGVEIARRTVAKYREALGIPGSARRRRAKALQI